jgi:hypothetical protein
MSNDIVDLVNGKTVWSVRTSIVPRRGHTVNVKGIDYAVTRVFYALDYSDRPSQDRALRATVELRRKRIDRPKDRPHIARVF